MLRVRTKTNFTEKLTIHLPLHIFHLPQFSLKLTYHSIRLCCVILPWLPFHVISLQTSLLLLQIELQRIQ